MVDLLKSIAGPCLIFGFIATSIYIPAETSWREVTLGAFLRYLTVASCVPLFAIVAGVTSIGAYIDWRKKRKADAIAKAEWKNAETIRMHEDKTLQESKDQRRERNAITRQRQTDLEQLLSKAGVNDPFQILKLVDSGYYAWNADIGKWQFDEDLLKCEASLKKIEIELGVDVG